MTQPETPSVSSAELQWDEQGRPVSSEYQDIYFSRASGLQETEYVFLHSNQLPERWQALQQGQCFTVAETGFGTGLNFLASWKCWQQTAPEGTRFHFVSVEKHPLSHVDLQKSLQLWPQLQSQSEQLLAAYPPACNGCHRLEFEQGRVTLTLMFGEAESMFQQLAARVDAWYLDGFAPSKNPQMWTPDLFSAMARLSHSHTSFSTFTAAGIVRRGLQAAGFSVRKVPGFGSKREMLVGQFNAAESEATDSPPARTPAAGPERGEKIWYSQPCAQTTDGNSARKAVVVGAGIAGCSAAFALARRGWQVEIIDSAAGPAAAASGNAQGVLYAKLPAIPTLQSRIHLAGYLYSQRLLHQLLPDSELWSPCGVLQLAMNPREVQKQRKLLEYGHYPQQLVSGVDAATASELAGVQLNQDGLWFPTSGWVNPPGLCRALIDHANIHSRYSQHIAALRRDSESSQWQLLNTEGEVVTRAAAVVVATARDAARFEQLKNLPLKSIRGQVSRFSRPAQPDLRTVLCGKSYISPPWRGQYCFGATFDLNSEDPDVRKADHQENLANTAQMAPELGAALASVADGERHGRVGFRCTSPDYLPIIGAVADHQCFINDYAELRNNARASLNTPPPHLPGLFVSLAHGSKGMITAPLAGELIASQICDEPLPLEAPLLDALNPVRFIVKDLVRRAI